MRLRNWQEESKKAKSGLLDETQRVTNLHRQSVLRLIGGDLARQPRRQQRGKTYGVEVKAVVEKVAYSLEYPCAERVQPNLVWLAGAPGSARGNQSGEWLGISQRPSGAFLAGTSPALGAQSQSSMLQERQSLCRRKQLLPGAH